MDFHRNQAKLEHFYKAIMVVAKHTRAMPGRMETEHSACLFCQVENDMAIKIGVEMLAKLCMRVWVRDLDT